MRDTHPPQDAPGNWYLAATSAELKPARQLRRMILGEPVMLARTAAGDAFALRDVCPHRLVPLSAGRQVDTDGEPTIECPYHGWRFAADGVCRLLPSLSDHTPHDAERIRVRKYGLYETSGAIFLYVSDDRRETGAPGVAPPGFGPLPARPKFALTRACEQPAEAIMEWLADTGREAFVLSARSPATRVFAGDKAVSEVNFQPPGFRLESAQNGRACLWVLTCLTPETARRTRLTQLAWWTGAPWLNLAIPALRSAFARSLDAARAPSGRPIHSSPDT